MESFEQLNVTKFLNNAISDLGFLKPTPIQSASFSVIRSGKDMVGIAQTGTGKTLAYMLPILQDFKFVKIDTPRVVVLVPTRELVLQLVENIERFTEYMSVRVLGVYGGTNINTQKQAVVEGVDVLVATPGRFYDLAMTRVLQLKTVKQLVIDEVDVMLDLGFRSQLTNILDVLPERRQNILFSATMTEDVDALIDNFFVKPEKVCIAVSGTPLDNIEQTAYPVKNFYTKANLLTHLLKDKEVFGKVLVFASSKKMADRLFEVLEEHYGQELCVVHSNKSQNYRIRSIEQFEAGDNRILIATDVMARGLDLDKITHVINIDVPVFPENYMHRIGRTGRAEEEGKSILFYTEEELEHKVGIERLMGMEISNFLFPKEVEESNQLTPEERPQIVESNHNRNAKKDLAGPAFHEKSKKNSKTNQGGSYRRELAKKYKKRQTRGDKKVNNRKKK